MKATTMPTVEIKLDDRVTVSGSRFQVLQQATYPVGWFECLQETGSAAVVGTKALLSPNMIATGNRASPMPG
jgi:hypothetical protein